MIRQALVHRTVGVKADMRTARVRALTLMIIGLLLTVLVPLSMAIADPDLRQTGVDLPDWQVEDTWNYYTDDDFLDPYPVVRVDNDAVLCNYPSSREIYQTYSVEDEGAQDYTMDMTEDIDEPGTWMMRRVIANQVKCDAGDVLSEGTYERTDNNTGTMALKVQNLNPAGDVNTVHSYTEYIGDYYFTITIDGLHTTTMDKACQDWKPDWATSPMEKNDTWKMDCTEIEVYDDKWIATGNLQGEFEDVGTYTFIYDINQTVSSVATKIVLENTYPDSHKVVGTGLLTWEWEDDQGHTSNGEGNVLIEKWFADQGDYWDAGWGIEYDGIKQLQWSTYGPPIDWNNPPEVIDPPPEAISIDEEEEWTFDDYVVRDLDPGACGYSGFVYSVKALYDGDEVLDNLTIDRDGVITFTPGQENVADGYELVITVSDSCPDAALSVDLPIELDIKNVNDLPVADDSDMRDIWMQEDNFTIPEWSLYDVFTDVDMGISDLTGQQYDPWEELEYGIESNGSLWVDIDEESGLVIITAPDLAFPVNQNVSITFTARDRSKAKVSASMTVHVSHTNHAPYLLDGEDEIELDEDTTVTLDFEDYFADTDVDNPAYLTDDNLYYFGWARNNITVEMDGHRFKIVPWQNWSGAQTVNIRASDSRGGRVETTLEVTVLSVNDPPRIYFQTPSDEYHELDEPHDGLPGNGLPRAIVLSVTATDIDGPKVFFNWTVTDVDTGDVLEWDLGNQSMKSFSTSFIGEFEDGKFTGGDTSKEYIVECVVSDGIVDIDGGRWVITVYDVNRPPRVSNIEVGLNKGGTGIMVPQVETDWRNYTLSHGKLYELSILNGLKDDDTALSDLICEWSTDRGQTLASGACDEYGAINVSAAVKRSKALAKLGPGDHVVTVQIMDDKDAGTSMAITLKVEDEPPPAWQTMDLDLTMIAIFIIVFLVMVIVGFLIAMLRLRSRPVVDPPGHVPKPSRPGVAKAGPSKPVPGPMTNQKQVGTVKDGKGKRKVKAVKGAGPQKKVAKKGVKAKEVKAKEAPGPVDKAAESEGPKVDGAGEKKKGKWVEDIPEDWR